MVVASFCIPTYNRSGKVYNLVQSLLNERQEDDFEVVVLNNNSSDETHDLLSSVTDKRFSYYFNKENVIGPLNLLMSLSLAKGKYAILCLDKDFIDVNYLNIFLDRLRTMPDVAYGYCVLNIEGVHENSYFSSGIDSLYNMAYLSAHPTGMFYNTSLYLGINFLERIVNRTEIFGFYPDIINGEMAMMGPSTILRIPIFRTESLQECEEVKSFTFRSEEDLFFTPKNRFKHFSVYMKFLASKDIQELDKVRVLSRVYLDQLLAATIEYRNVLGNYSVCKHYYIEPRIVSVFELFSIYVIFNFRFIKEEMSFSFLQKLRVIESQSIGILFTLCKKYLGLGERTIHE
jgi:glycosyltransferase involved in cell wall biosynthesis